MSEGCFYDKFIASLLFAHFCLFHTRSTIIRPATNKNSDSFGREQKVYEVWSIIPLDNPLLKK